MKLFFAVSALVFLESASAQVLSGLSQRAVENSQGSKLLGNSSEVTASAGQISEIRPSASFNVQPVPKSAPLPIYQEPESAPQRSDFPYVLAIGVIGIAAAGYRIVTLPRPKATL